MRNLRVRMFLGLQDPDPFVIGTDPEADPSLFRNNASKIGFQHKILAKNLILKTEDNVPLDKSHEKKI
jgi:hypothetical protein